jgi:anthranilate phosphoribosyltransferase
MIDLKEIILKLSQNHRLNEEEASKAFSIIMSGEAQASQVGAFLMALRLRGETITEITAAAKLMRLKAKTIEAPEGAIDTCGTGGDASGTYNISTAAAIVIAAAGVPVAKHGNKAQSSKLGSGSAEVLATLGVNIEADLETVRHSLWTNHIGFLMAPNHHLAMQHVGQIRKDIGMRTIFNLLGPLANPAGTKRQLLGVYSQEWIEPLAQVLGNLGAEKAWVVHGTDGLDELTTTGPSYVTEWAHQRIRSFMISPEEAGLPLSNPDSLKGGTAEFNARAMRQIFEGQKCAYRDIVLLNASAGLIIANKINTLKEGVMLATQIIDSGQALAKLNRMISLSHHQSPY